MSSELEVLLATIRAALLQHEAAMNSALITVFGTQWESIADAVMQSADDNQALLELVQQAITTTFSAAIHRITEAQHAAEAQADDDAIALIVLITGLPEALSAGTSTSETGQASSGGLLTTLFAMLAAETIQRITMLLRSAQRAEWSELTIRRLIHKELGSTLNSLLTTARSSMMHVYRERTWSIYKQNPMVDGWIWAAKLDTHLCELLGDAWNGSPF